MPHAGNPWETGGQGKYQYYPGGDRSAEPKDAPSAVNTVVVPNVNLPKVRTQILLPSASDAARAAVVVGCEGRPYIEAREADMGTIQELHEKYNKWGKDGY